MKTLLPESINALIARSNQIQDNSDFLQERAQQEKNEEQEEVECNLFSRVFDICTMNNRTISDLFKDIEANHDGHISFEELRMELIKYDPTITKEESQTIFSILDGDGDGKITWLELSKRMKFIKERVDQERADPLSCIVISKPLNPMLVHGNLSVMLIKGEEFKAGTRCVKIKVEDNMEYITPETTESTHLWNFRANFLFENKSPREIPLFVDVELLNKNIIEGTGSFQWKKAMNNPNMFSVKSTVIMKTSTGQLRGKLYFQVQWTPITVKVYTNEEIERMNILEKQIREHKQHLKEIKELEKRKRIEEEKIDEVSALDESSEDYTPKRHSISSCGDMDYSPTKPIEYSYSMLITQKSLAGNLEQRSLKNISPFIRTRTVKFKTSPDSSKYN